MKKRKTRHGQISLLILMGTVFVFVVALSSLRASTEGTRLAELEESAKQAYTAARSGIDAALENSSETSITFDGIEVNTTIDDSPTDTFTTPRISKDDQHTYYLTPFDEDAGQFSGDPYSGTFTITLSEPETPQCETENGKFAVELSFIDFTEGGESVNRRLIDPCDLFEGEYHEWSFGSEYTLSNETPSPIGAHVVVARVLSPSLSFDGVSLTFNDSANASQGTVITSTATTNTGVAKKMQLFKSYPQIPAQLFITSF